MVTAAMEILLAVMTMRAVPRGTMVVMSRMQMLTAIKMAGGEMMVVAMVTAMVVTVVTVTVMIMIAVEKDAMGIMSMITVVMALTVVLMMVI